MRFAFVVTNLAGGGAEKSILKLAAALAQRRHDVHLVLLEHRIEHTVPADIRVHALTRPGRRLHKGVLGKALAALRLRRVFRQMAAHPFDAVVSTLPFADEVTARARLPHHWCRIANTLSAEVAGLRGRKARRRLRRYRRLYDARALIAVSDGVAHDLRNVLGLARARIVRIYNPFDFAAIRAAAGERGHALPDVPYIIHVGRLAPQKRHDLLLDAFAMLKTEHRLVLLTAPDRRLAAMIEARGLASRVIIAGFQPNPYPWIAGAELLVLSSDHEGLPNVLIEALALGTPVVSTDCPSGPREILSRALPECLVPVNDAPALARTIAQVLAHPPDSARADLGEYAADTVIGAYEQLARPAPLDTQ